MRIFGGFCVLCGFLVFFVRDFVAGFRVFVCAVLRV